MKKLKLYDREISIGDLIYFNNPEKEGYEFGKLTGYLPYHKEIEISFVDGKWKVMPLREVQEKCH